MSEEEIKTLIKEEIDELKGNVSESNNTLEKIENNKIDSLIVNLDRDFNIQNFGLESFCLDNIEFIKFISNMYRKKVIYLRSNQETYLVNYVSIDQVAQWVHVICQKTILNYATLIGQEDDFILKNLNKTTKEVYCFGDFRRKKSYFKIKEDV